MGNSLNDQGKLGEAIEADEAISINPHYAEAHRTSFVKQYTIDDEHFLLVKELAKQRKIVIIQYVI